MVDEDQNSGQKLFILKLTLQGLKIMMPAEVLRRIVIFRLHGDWDDLRTLKMSLNTV